MFTPHKILVTGAAGFIGCNFVRDQLAKYSDVEIVSLDKLTYAGSLHNLADILNHPRHNFVQADICDFDLISQVLRKYKIDTIVNFAAESHVDNSIKNPETFVQTNIVGTFTLLEAARQYWLESLDLNATQCRFHHISTDEVYGTLTVEAAAFTENTAYAPNSPYSASKAGADHLVRAYHHTYNLPMTISNCSNNYGPYQHKEKLIPTIINACLREKLIPIYGNGSNIRDWLYVMDHVNALDVIIRQSQVGQMYNIGARNEQSNIEIADMICQQLDSIFPRANGRSYASLITYVADRPGHDWRYAIDNSKIQTELNWQPSMDFETGMQLTIQFYLQNQKKLINLPERENIFI